MVSPKTSDCIDIAPRSKTVSMKDSHGSAIAASGLSFHVATSNCNARDAESTDRKPPEFSRTRKLAGGRWPFGSPLFESQGQNYPLLAKPIVPSQTDDLVSRAAVPEP